MRNNNLITKMTSIILAVLLSVGEVSAMVATEEGTGCDISEEVIEEIELDEEEGLIEIDDPIDWDTDESWMQETDSERNEENDIASRTMEVRDESDILPDFDDNLENTVTEEETTNAEETAIEESNNGSELDRTTEEEVPLEITISEELGEIVLILEDEVRDEETADNAKTESETIDERVSEASDEGLEQDEERVELEMQELNASAITYTISDTIKGVLAGGVFTVSGTGRFDGYYYGNYAPWYDVRDQIKKVVISDGITTVGSRAFYDCMNLEEIIFADSVTNIFNNAFWRCPKLKTISLPPNLKGYSTAFAGCSGIEKVMLNEGCTYIEANSCSACPNLKYFYISSTVTDIRDGAFANNSLEWIEVAEDNPVYSSKDGVLYNKEKTVLMVMPRERNLTSFDCTGLTGLGSNAFHGMDTLTSINLASVTKIGDKALAGTGLVSLDIPDTVTEMGYNAIGYCVRLKNVSFGKGLSELPTHCFTLCNALESVTLPESMTSTGALAFYECRNLRTVTAKGLKIVGYGAFGKCGQLTEVNLNEGVEKIYRGCFNDCPSLTEITLPSTVKHVEALSFDETTTVHYLTTGMTELYGGAAIEDSFSITGERNYDFAYEVLELVNQERQNQGLNALTMEESLLETAMVRAAECAVCFGHTRSNSFTCSTMNALMTLENIAYGQTTPAVVVDSWMQSRGHRRNILDEKSQFIGIGCFLHNGVFYWVQCFSSKTGNSNFVRPANREVTEPLLMARDPFKEAPAGLGVVYSITTGDAGTEKVYSYDYRIRATSTFLMPGESMNVLLEVTNAGSHTTKAILDSESVIWGSSNETVAKVDASGNVKALGAGKADIIASSQLGEKARITITVCPYTDVAGDHPYFEEILDMYNRGLMTGMRENIFEPETGLNRAFIAAVLYRRAGSPSVAFKKVFPDVREGAWFANCVLWAHASGNILGYQNGYFGPTDDLTREQLCTILWRCAVGIDGYDNSERASLENYPDAVKVSSFAKDAVAWCVATGIIVDRNGRLDAWEQATRAECDAMVSRYLKWIKK